MKKSGLFNKRDLIAYFFVAASGALINLLIGSVSQSWFAISYKEALTLGYLTASAFGFFLTKIFAFSNKNATKSRREMIKFSLVMVLSFFITVYGSDLLLSISIHYIGLYDTVIPYSVKTVDLNKLFSQLFCMGLSFTSNCILHKRFTFNDTGFYERLKRLL